MINGVNEKQVAGISSNSPVLPSTALSVTSSAAMSSSASVTTGILSAMMSNMVLNIESSDVSEDLSYERLVSSGLANTGEFLSLPTVLPRDNPLAGNLVSSDEGDDFEDLGGIFSNITLSNDVQTRVETRTCIGGGVGSASGLDPEIKDLKAAMDICHKTELFLQEKKHLILSADYVLAGPIGWPKIFLRDLISKLEAVKEPNVLIAISSAFGVLKKEKKILEIKPLNLASEHEGLLNRLLTALTDIQVICNAKLESRHAELNKSPSGYAPSLSIPPPPSSPPPPSPPPLPPPPLPLIGEPLFMSKQTELNICQQLMPALFAKNRSSFFTKPLLASPPPSRPLPLLPPRPHAQPEGARRDNGFLAASSSGAASSSSATLSTK